MSFLSRVFSGNKKEPATDLSGKVVIVTGAARGMGKLHAMSFAREGAKVVIADVDEEELGKAAREMKAEGLEPYPYRLDVSDRGACLAFAEKVTSDVGPIDVLINNAAIVVCDYLLDTPESALRRMVDVNYLGQVWMMQAVVPDMIERRKGHVVNICSSAGKLGVARLGGYCATKFALIGVTDALRPELHGTGVKTTIVNPGFVQTGMFRGARTTTWTRWQDPQSIADRVLTAVKRGQAEICVPRLAVWMAAFLRGLCLPRFTDWFYHKIGGNRAFITWEKDQERPF